MKIFEGLMTTKGQIYGRVCSGGMVGSGLKAWRRNDGVIRKISFRVGNDLHNYEFKRMADNNFGRFMLRRDFSLRSSGKDFVGGTKISRRMSTNITRFNGKEKFGFEYENAKRSVGVFSLLAGASAVLSTYSQSYNRHEDSTSSVNCDSAKFDGRFPDNDESHLNYDDFKQFQDSYNFQFNDQADEKHRDKEDVNFQDKVKRSVIAFGPYAIADAVELAVPALVNITLSIQAAWGMEGRAAGSGFIFDSKRGLIATNYHVVKHAAGETMQITLSNGDIYKAKLHSFDKLTDIAVLEIIDATDPLPEVRLGSSSNLRPGEWVIALGSPLNLQNTVTAGIVSSVNRQMSDLGLTQGRTDYLQIDAALNPGNSGGPVINLQGEVVGIATLQIVFTGLGCAIPIDTAKIVLSQLVQKRRVDRPYLGIKMVAVTEKIGGRRSKGFFGSTPTEPLFKEGLLITTVKSNSPASKAGLQPGDIILEIDDQKVKSSYDVVKAIGYDIGRTHRFHVLRQDGRKHVLSVTTTQALFE